MLLSAFREEEWNYLHSGNLVTSTCGVLNLRFERLADTEM
jgi:hypothetical protein